MVTVMIPLRSLSHLTFRSRISLTRERKRHRRASGTDQNHSSLVTHARDLMLVSRVLASLALSGLEKPLTCAHSEAGGKLLNTHNQKEHGENPKKAGREGHYRASHHSSCIQSVLLDCGAASATVRVGWWERLLLGWCFHRSGASRLRKWRYCGMLESGYCLAAASISGRNCYACFLFFEANTLLYFNHLLLFFYGRY
jgi:hypothetical protein